MNLGSVTALPREGNSGTTFWIDDTTRASLDALGLPNPGVDWYREDFDLEEFAARSFGVCQEEPVDVALRFAPEAAEDVESFLFHPRQEMENDEDGSLIVRFGMSDPNERYRNQTL